MLEHDVLQIEVEELNLTTIADIAVEAEIAQDDKETVIVAKPYQVRILCDEINEHAPPDMRMGSREIMELMSGHSYFSLYGVTISVIDPREH